MRKERITYKDLVRKILGGRLLRGDERRIAEEILGIPDTLEVARRLGDLLAQVARRGGLIPLARAEDEPNVRRYLDPATNDHWAVELPGPRPVAGAGAGRTATTDVPGPGRRAPAGESGEAASVTPPTGAAPEEVRGAEEKVPPPSPRLVLPVEELRLEPSVARRFQDDATGEPLRTLFSTFSPCKTPEELGESLAPIRDQILERTGATAIRFHLLAEPGEELSPIPFRDLATPAHIPLGERVRERVLGARRMLHVPNLGAPGTDARPEDRGALVSVPLVSGEVLTGLMEVVRDTPGPFDEDELRFFALAALTAAGVMVRAEVLERLIFLDKLTGLYNRAYFDEQIEREIERANRSGTSVALLMADLDHFKRINDNFGHQVGDRALAHVAGIIRANIRQIDVASRYGGEEFSILLPAMTRRRAVRAAERLRQVVAESRVGTIIPELGDARLSLSLGVALYPDDAGTSRQLIDRADRVALYAAKNRGRNRVVSWAEARETSERLRPGA